MTIQQAVSLWNYNYYHHAPDLERIMQSLREHDLGIELWDSWQQDDGLYRGENQERLKNALEGMPVSLHAAIGINTRSLLFRQIDLAAALGARVLVIHADNISFSNEKRIDVDLGHSVVSHGQSCGVQIALENGQLPVLKQALNDIDGLKICLDTGHVYLTDSPMRAFLDEFIEDIVHLHLQDILAPEEQVLVGKEGILMDHYTTGTGGIPHDDWGQLFQALKDVKYNGMAVFEVHPRSPLQTALLGKIFIDGFLQNG